MTEAEKLDQIRKVLGFGTPSSARENLSDAAFDIDQHEKQICDANSRRTITRVLSQLAEAEKLLHGTATS